MKTFGRQAVGRQTALQLHSSEPVALESEIEGEYLQVMITLAESSGVEQVFLLMAELTWEVG
jgi:hypothetical protein